MDSTLMHKKIFFTALIIFLISGCDNNNVINIVQQSPFVLDDSYTNLQAFDNRPVCSTTSWESFEDNRGREIIQYTCTLKDSDTYLHVNRQEAIARIEERYKTRVSTVKKNEEIKANEINPIKEAIQAHEIAIQQSEQIRTPDEFKAIITGASNVTENTPLANVLKLYSYAFEKRLFKHLFIEIKEPRFARYKNGKLHIPSDEELREKREVRLDKQYGLSREARLDKMSLEAKEKFNKDYLTLNQHLKTKLRHLVNRLSEKELEIEQLNDRYKIRYLQLEKERDAGIDKYINRPILYVNEIIQWSINGDNIPSIKYVGLSYVREDSTSDKRSDLRSVLKLAINDDINNYEQYTKTLKLRSLFR